MNPQDDPEARIRALEPTELGAENTGYVPPPTRQWDQTPYTQPAYGQSPYGASPYGYTDPYQGAPYQSAPYPSGPPPSRSGFRPWMAIVPVVLILFVLAGGAAVYFLTSSTSTPGTPGIAGGGDVLTDEPDVPTMPSMPELPSMPALPSIDASPPTDGPAEPGSTVTISGIGATKSVTCNDNILIISGANNTVDIAGHCVAVTISGFKNVVTVDSTQEIAVSGFDNQVTYRTGSPQVSESGSGNSISQG